MPPPGPFSSHLSEHHKKPQKCFFCIYRQHANIKSWWINQLKCQQVSEHKTAAAWKMQTFRSFPQGSLTKKNMPINCVPVSSDSLNSHSGRGEDFLSRQPDFFTETAVTPERKVEKSFPRWEINRHAEAKNGSVHIMQDEKVGERWHCGVQLQLETRSVCDAHLKLCFGEK